MAYFTGYVQNYRPFVLLVMYYIIYKECISLYPIGVIRYVCILYTLQKMCKHIVHLCSLLCITYVARKTQAYSSYMFCVTNYVIRYIEYKIKLLGL